MSDLAPILAAAANRALDAALGIALFGLSPYKVTFQRTHRDRFEALSKQQLAERLAYEDGAPLRYKREPATWPELLAGSPDPGYGLKRYSTHAGGALAVIEAMGERGDGESHAWSMEMNYTARCAPYEWRCKVYLPGPKSLDAAADTMPRAVAEAALLALHVEGALPDHARSILHTHE